MTRKLPVLVTSLLAAGALAAGCGRDSGSSDSAAVDAADARTAVEKDAGVKLADTQLIKDGSKYGLLGSYANLDGVARDSQMVMLIVLDEAGKAGMIREQLQAAMPAGAEALEHENAVVLYASQGPDRSDAIEMALETL